MEDNIMKKFLQLLLAGALLFSAVSCSKSGTSDKQGEEDGVKESKQGDLGDVDKALDLLKTLIPEGWDENRYGAYIYNEWDEEFLPDCFPDPPSGIKVDQTTFKDYDHDTLNGSYSVGPLSYESYEDYRQYGVSFYANEEHISAIIADIEGKGMKGGLEDEGTWTFYSYFDGEYYLQIFIREAFSEEDYDYLVAIDATDSLHKLPESIDGIPLPQCGFVSSSYESGYYTIQDFSEGYEDIDFDLSKDKLPDEYFAAWFSYYCATAQDAKDYAQKLVSLGWELQYESESDGSYYASLYKDGVYAVSNYIHYDVEFQVGFSDMIENLTF